MNLIKKKIFFLAPNLSIGGAERVLVNLLKHLDYNRYDVTLCLYARVGVYFSELPKEVHIKYIFKNYFFSRVLTYLQRKWGGILLKYIVRGKIKKNYDIGICFSDGLLTDVLLMTGDRFENTLTWVHSCYCSQISLRKVYTPRKVLTLKKKRYDKLNGIVFVSKNSMLEFEQLFGKYPHEYCVYNLFDFKGIEAKADEYDPGLMQDRINFVAIGRLVGVKSYDKLIEAAKLLKERGLRFKINILGDGPLRNALENKVEAYKLQKEVELLGFKSNPYPYLKQSDALVLTSSSEALPTVLVEAMYFSRPIVATKCPGCMEISDGGKYALLTEHTVEDIADKMELIIRDEDVRDRYGELALKRCEYFDEDKTLSNIYKIFDSL